MINEGLRERLLQSCILHDPERDGKDPSGARGLKNIILIGMPGCGKSTISKLLAKDHGFKTVDTDQLFRERFGMTPAECITGLGEPEFRRRESEVLKSLNPGERMCIATGGGVVTVPENLPVLKRLGFIVYLKRDLDKLAVRGRPLSAGKGVERLFEERGPLYSEWADAETENRSLHETADRIMELYRKND